MTANEVLPVQAPEVIAETSALQAVRELLEANVLLYRTLGVDPPRTLLLSGPPGVGKSKAVRIAAKEAGLSTFSVTPGPHVSNTLRIAFRDALAAVSERKRCAKGSRVIVFIDEIDAVCPAPNKSSSDPTMSVATSTLLSFIDPPRKTRREKLESTIFVIAATNRPDALHPSLRRAGRFDREATLSPPSASERYKILCAMEPKAEDDLLHDVANRAIGFVAADLADLCRAARSLEEDASGPVSKTQQQKRTSRRSFMLALKRTRPSILRNAIAAEIPVATWDEVGGLSQVKKRLKMAVEWPLLRADTFKRLGLKAPRGILLHGPPGCSKTTLVRVAASQGNASFLRLNGADIYSCYLGEAERILREGFAMARAAAPCILFLDEIDAIVGKRSIDGSRADGNGVQERVLSTLLTEMDGIVSATGVLVVGATNRVDLLDDALLRPGRFDDILEVPMPDDEARLEILRIHTAKLSLGEDVNLEIIARQTAGKSGAEIASICTEAGLAALREIYVTNGVTQSPSSWNASHLSVTSRHFHFER